MNTKLLSIVLLFVLWPNPAIPQSTLSPREMFLEAESYFLYEEYIEALPLYVQLSVLYPRNDNINYRLGRCYLNIPYEKEKSISYLEQASKNINKKYKGYHLKETGAPPDVIFYMGDAYRVNNQLEKAITYYKRFKQNTDSAIFDHEMVDDQIRSCENAIQLITHPVDVSFTNIGEAINTRFSENNAVVSGDESTMLFSVQLQFYPAVFCSYKQNGSWSTPVNINPELGVDEDCFPVGLSYDGKELLLYRNNEYLGDLYVSKFANGKWSKIKRLNSNINTRFWESHACLSHDSKKLYFTSNRKGTYGGLDIFMSTRTDINQDNWGTPINLGPTVNSPLNDETPFITANERKLYFSSLGHNGMGGYDIFVCELTKDNTWGKPGNLGYPINTTDHDLFFQAVRDGSEGYISLSKKDSYGKTDIYKVKLSTPDAQLASINKALKEPEAINPSSEISRGILKPNQKENSVKQADFIAQVTEKNEPVSANIASNKPTATFTSLEKQETATDTSDKKVVKPLNINNTSNNDQTLSAGQKQAWHKLLYGGLGILAVFVFFILLLYRRSRQRKKTRTPDINL